MSATSPPSLDLARQKAFFLRCTSILPQAYTSADANMLSLAFFILAGLDLLGLVDNSAPSFSPSSGDDHDHLRHHDDVDDDDDDNDPQHISPAQKRKWIQWIYSFQATAYTGGGGSGGFRGTRFWDLGDQEQQQPKSLWEKRFWDRASLANTFMALLMLLMLGDDLAQLRKDELANWVKSLQSSSERGGFSEHLPGQGQGQGQVESENEQTSKSSDAQKRKLKRDGGDNNGNVNGDDMRMCYCAAGIAYILGPEYDCLDAARLRKFVVNTQGYEGGIGQTWAMEGHSGLNYCAIGCMALLDRLEQRKRGEGRHNINDRLKEHGFDVLQCVRYMLMRQTSWIEDRDDEEEDEEGEEDGDQKDVKLQDNKDGTTQHEYFGVAYHQGQQQQQLQQTSPSCFIAGFNGRTNKMADTCYCFWNLSALDILGVSDLADHDALRRYLLEKTQHQIGGFSKAPGEYPDLMHSYLGLAALALMAKKEENREEKELRELDPALCVSVGVWKRIQQLHGAAAAAATPENGRGRGSKIR